MSSDMLDILDVGRVTEEVTKDAILGSQNANKPKKRLPVALRKPEGMAREVYNLFDRDDPPPLFMTDFKPSASGGAGYKNIKANLGIKKVRPWRWSLFANPARTDDCRLRHWVRAGDENKEYAFAKFNKQVSIPEYTDQEYHAYLMGNTWTKAETDYLFDMARRFDLRFIIIHDRWDREKYQDRSVEDIKHRYYSVCNCLKRVWAAPGTEVKIQAFDADHERRRKEQLHNLLSRTQEQVEEEQYLIQELRKIDLRKKEREKKTQDLQKLIQDNEQRSMQQHQQHQQPQHHGGQRKTAGAGSSASGGSSAVGGSSGGSALAAKRTSKKDRQGHVQAAAGVAPSGATDVDQIERNAVIRFADIKLGAPSLRSARMKLPASIGQKKSRVLEQNLREAGVDPNPPAFEDIANNFNELRNLMLLHHELKQALTTIEYELSTLRLQLAERNKLTTTVTTTTKDGDSSATDADAANPTANADVDVVDNISSSTPCRPSAGAVSAETLDTDIGTSIIRKRKAALEQVNVLKSLKKI